nr:hypothetical protein [Tanacetum cinerariifolium]
MNQNFYNSNSSGFDQTQPSQSLVIHQPPQEMSIQEIEDLKHQYFDEMKRLINLKYRNEIKIDELKGNFNSMSIEINKKEKLLQLEQLANLSTYPSKCLNSFCYDDDNNEDYIIAVTPVLSTKEPDNSLSMGDEHLDTIPATESDEVIKSSVEDLVPIPSEFEGIPDTMCDVHLVNNPTLLEAKDHFEIVINSNDDYSSSDDDYLYNENIDYVNLLIAKIEALKDNPTPSSEFLTKSSSTSHISFLEKTNTFDDSLPELENFCFDFEEISSGSTTTHSDISLSEYDSKGCSPDTGLFREPSATSSRAKLYPNGKVMPGASLRIQKVTQILPGRLQKWRVMLGEYNITYRPWTSVKGQILADFLVEKLDDAPPEASVIKTPQELWVLFTDESSCVDRSGARLILTSLEGTKFTYALRFQFTASNNEAKYEALIASLRIAMQMGVHNVYMSVDSKLVINQVLGTYVTKEENMIKYLEKAKSLISGFANFSISQVPRSKNKKADALSKIASTSFVHLSKQVLVKVLKEKSIQEREMATIVEEEGPTCMTPIIEYLRDETLPYNKKEKRKLRIKARQYELLEGILYRRSFLKPWLSYVGPLPADYVIREIHEGSCSMHAGPRSVVAKAMWSGQVKKFEWDNIVCRFGLPGEIVSDNGKQFSGDLFKYWCEKLSIVQCFASIKHPQSNGLVERANRSMGEGVKARLGEGNKNWLEELPHVLWAHRTMIKSSNDDTSFSLTYGMEAVIPVEIGMPTYRTTVVDVVHNDEELRLNLDLLKERRERAAIRESKAKLKMTKYYNARVKCVTFRPGDFIYRSNDASHAVDGGKLGLKWEGPYKVTKALGDEAYKLRSTNGTVLLRT